MNRSGNVLAMKDRLAEGSASSHPTWVLSSVVNYAEN